MNAVPIREPKRDASYIAIIVAVIAVGVVWAWIKR